MKYLLTLISISFIFVSASCIGDCNQNVGGIVVDSLTKEPLDSVMIINPKKYDTVFTDKKGKFYTHDISGGFTGCPAMTLSISKNNYKPIFQTYESGRSVTIALSRSK